MRGLKFDELVLLQRELLSHPSRVRGLKFDELVLLQRELLSHPSRVRGLKFNLTHSQAAKIHVAPFAGAWIEICFVNDILFSPLFVAPFAGAWIEIERTYFHFYKSSKSHPSRVRGLKCLSNYLLFDLLLSHPSRVRGLKS